MSVEVFDFGHEGFGILDERDHVLQQGASSSWLATISGGIWNSSMNLWFCMSRWPLPATTRMPSIVEFACASRNAVFDLQFGLRLFALCDIAENSVRIQNSIFLVGAGSAIVNPDPCSIFSADAIFLVKGALLFKKSTIAPIHAAKILRVNQTRPEIPAGGAEFLLRVPKNRLHLRTHIGRPALPVRCPGHVRDAGQNSAKLLLARLQGVSSLMYLGDVFGHSSEHRNLAVRAADGLGMVLDPARRTVAMPDLIFAARLLASHQPKIVRRSLFLDARELQDCATAKAPRMTSWQLCPVMVSKAGLA